MMNGKITRSFSGNTGRTSGILIASSFAVSFASDMCSSVAGNYEHSCNGYSCPVPISRFFGAGLLPQFAPVQPLAQEENHADHDHRHHAHNVKKYGRGDRGVDVESIESCQHPLTDFVKASDPARG